MAISLSHGQLLESIELTQQLINTHIEALERERSIRDELIQEALIQKTPYRTLMKLTGLSRTALVKLQERGIRSYNKVEDLERFRNS